MTQLVAIGATFEELAVAHRPRYQPPFNPQRGAPGPLPDLGPSGNEARVGVLVLLLVLAPALLVLHRAVENLLFLPSYLSNPETIGPAIERIPCASCQVVRVLTREHDLDVVMAIPGVTEPRSYRITGDRVSEPKSLPSIVLGSFGRDQIDWRQLGPVVRAAKKAGGIEELDVHVCSGEGRAELCAKVSPGNVEYRLATAERW